MYRLALLFLCVTLAAAYFGFGGVENSSWEGAKIIFYLFLALTVITFASGRLNRPVPGATRRS